MESLQMESLQCHDESGVINIARGDSANNTASSPAPPRVMSPKHFETHSTVTQLTASEYDETTWPARRDVDGVHAAASLGGGAVLGRAGGGRGARPVGGAICLSGTLNLSDAGVKRAGGNLGAVSARTGDKHRYIKQQHTFRAHGGICRRL
eukprot:scaffold133305_cov71-Phaeocystis_antarctica.AAC.2